jgi:hypothetical protein
MEHKLLETLIILIRIQYLQDDDSVTDGRFWNIHEQVEVRFDD